MEELKKGTKMAKLKLKAQRKQVDFTYEFPNGDEVDFTFIAMNTKQLDIVMDSEGGKEILKAQKKMIHKNITGDKKEIARMIEDLNENGNLYDFIGQLQEAAGKQKK